MKPTKLTVENLFKFLGIPFINKPISEQLILSDLAPLIDRIKILTEVQTIFTVKAIHLTENSIAFNGINNSFTLFFDRDYSFKKPGGPTNDGASFMPIDYDITTESMPLTIENLLHYCQVEKIESLNSKLLTTLIINKIVLADKHGSFQIREIKLNLPRVVKFFGNVSEHVFIIDDPEENEEATLIFKK